MIGFTGSNYTFTPASAANNTSNTGTYKVLRMEARNDRTAGSIPVWTNELSAKESVTSNLEMASLNGSTRGNEIGGKALAYNSTTGTYRNSEEFGFADLLDMINPLQHIPIVGNIYRSITGDEIKPASKIIGGGIFGGAIGAASGLVNVIVQEETGKDLAENAYSFATGGRKDEDGINNFGA